MSNFSPKLFAKLPGIEELESLLTLYMEAYGERKYKVGMVKQSSMASRYPKVGDRYQPLTQASIFAIGSYEVLLSVETEVMRLLASKKMSANSIFDNGDKIHFDCLLDSDERFIVYLTPPIDDPYECTRCRTYGTKDFIAQHMKTHSVTSLITATRKDMLLTGGTRKEFWVVNEPIRHFQVFMGYEGNCEYCGIEVDTSNGRSRHPYVCSKNPNTKYPCWFGCDLSFQRDSNWKEHLEAHKNDERFKTRDGYECPKCKRRFPVKSDHTQHVNFCGVDEKPHKCTKEGCDKMYKLVKDRNAHSKICGSNDRPHVCPRCGADFVKKNKLNRHMLQIPDCKEKKEAKLAKEAEKKAKEGTKLAKK